MTGNRPPGTRSPAGRRRVLAAALGATAVTALAACATSADEPTRPAATAGTSPTVSAEPPSGAPVGPGDAVRTLVVRDDGGSWPDLLAARLEGAGVPMLLTGTAVPGSGFASAPSFAEQVQRGADGTTQLVVLVDRTVDPAGDAGAMTEAAQDTFVAVERAAPDARVVVVGPGRPGPAADALRAVAGDWAAEYVDPVADGWPEAPTPEEAADLLLPTIEPIAAVLAASGANR